MAESLPRPLMQGRTLSTDTGGSALVPQIAPHHESIARSITSINDFRHTTAETSNNAPTYDTSGRAHFPGKGSGTRITGETAGPLRSTASGLASDPFDRFSPSQHRTRTELLAARRSAMRAPLSYDLGGDGVVDQKEYFYATRFDANGDGEISQGERETAGQMMRSAASDKVFLSPRGAKFHRNAFSRYSQAVVPGHHTLQERGAIVSEQLGGYAELTRSRLPGGGGAAATLGPKGAHLPPDIAERVGEVLLSGVSGADRFSGVEVDQDTSDNVVNLHMEGSAPDFDRVEVKPNFRPHLYASGSKLRSELIARRKAERVPALSYDVDGDGAVSARDYFFAARKDRRGTHRLSMGDREAASREERGEGMGAQFIEIKGDGAGQLGHRVMGVKGVVVADQTPGGWASLTHAHMHGSVVVQGADGNLHVDHSVQVEKGVDESGGGGRVQNLGKVLDTQGLTTNGKVAMETVAGAVTDYDTVTVKPHYRPHLLSSGVKSVRELQLHRRLDKRPDPSFDLTGAGSVSAADYALAKRYDGGDKGYLTPAEASRAQEEIAGGIRDSFVQLSTGSSRALSTRTFQRADGVVECEGADMVAGASSEPPYDSTVKLPTKGVVPALDLPAEVASGVGLGGSRVGTATNFLIGSGLNTYSASLKPVDKDAPYVFTSMGVVPGVSRAIVRYPGGGGEQEAFGGYAGGLDAGGINNVTAPPLPFTPAQDIEGSTLRGAHHSLTSPLKPDGTARFTLEATSHSHIDFSAPPPTTTQTTLRPLPSLYPEAPFRTHNQTTFCDPQARGVVHSQAPYALMGVGGAGDGVVAWDTLMTLQRSTSVVNDLKTASQLKKARRVAMRGDLSQPLPAATVWAGDVSTSAPPLNASFTTIPGLSSTFSTLHNSSSSNAPPTAGTLGGGGGGVVGRGTMGGMTVSMGTPVAGAPSDASIATAVAVANTFSLEQTKKWLAASSTVAGAATVCNTLHATGGVNPGLPAHGSTLADERATAYTKPTGEAPVIDGIGQGAFTGGLSHLSTALSQSVMPSHLNSHVIHAANTSARVLTETPGSPHFSPQQHQQQQQEGGGGGGGETLLSVSTKIPAYMSRSLEASTRLNVDPVELPPELIKPGALDETVRTAEATTASALKALRRKSASWEARSDFDAVDDEGFGSGPTPSVPQMYPPHYNDSSFESAGHPTTLPLGGGGVATATGVLQGVSKTRSQLKGRLKAEAITASMPFAPTEVLGIHPAPLPSYAARLSHKGVPWHKDRSHLDTPLVPPSPMNVSRGVAGGESTYTAVVSALEGPAPFEDPSIAALPDNLRGIPPTYDAALRHTVRAPHLMGISTTTTTSQMHPPEGGGLEGTLSQEDLAATRTLRPTLARASVGAKNPRLIVDGLQREEECVDAASGAFDKVREVNPTTQGKWVRDHSGKKGLLLTDKVTAIDPAQVVDVTPAHFTYNAGVPRGSPAGGGGSGFAYSPSKDGGDPAAAASAAASHGRLYEIHPNVSTLGTCLPGAPPVEAEKDVRAALLASPFRLNAGTGSWSASLLEHAQRCEGVPLVALAEDGKVPAVPADTKPLFSSFSSDGAFQPPYFTPKGLPLQPTSPSRKLLAAAQSQSGGSVRHGGAVTHFTALPTQGIPGPENPRPLLSALVGDREARRGSVYGVEVRVGGVEDVTVRGGERGRWGENGEAASTLRSSQHTTVPSPPRSERGGRSRLSSAPSTLPPSTKYGGVRTGGFKV